MNEISKLRNIFMRSKQYVNSFNRKYIIKNIVAQSKTPIIFGTVLLGVGYASYLLIDNKFKFKTNSLLNKSEGVKVLETKLERTNKISVDVIDESNVILKVLSEKEKLSDTIIFEKPSDPNVLNGLPTEVPYVIIGAGIAGMSAARSIRASDPFAKVLIINSECQNPGEHKDAYPPYRRILLSKFIWRRSEEQQHTMLVKSGDVKSSSLLFIEPESFFVEPERLSQLEYGGISLLNNTRVANINPEESSITLEGSGHKIMYKACLIATGSSPRRLKQLEISNNTEKDLFMNGRVSYFRSLNDYRNLFEKIKQLQSTEKGGRILIVGSGLLGTELTCGLSKLPKQVGKLEIIEVFKEKSHLYHLLPETLSLYVKRNIERNEVKLVPQSEVVSIDEVTDGENGGRLNISIRPLLAHNDGHVINEEVDHVIIAAGVKPDTVLAEHCNLETDPILGGFLVNSELQARQGVYVAGDACSFYDPMLGCRRRVEHWDHSEESGNIAGHNMAAFVLKTYGKDTLARLDTSLLANDILRPISYTHQSSFSFKLSMFKTVEAMGVIDSNLETVTFVAEDFFDELDLEDDDAVKQAKALEPVRKTRDKLDMPGVVFYLRQKRIVGILLWNCDDDIIVDSDFPSPLRTNVARKLLSERRTVASHDDLRQLASDFDLSFFVNSQIKFLDDYTKKMKENNQPESQKS